MEKKNETSIDYLAVLADLEARRDALNVTIAGIRQMLGVGGEGATTSGPVATAMAIGNGRNDVETTIRPDSFFKMSIPEATIKYLNMVRQPKSVADICDALRAGGVHSTAKDFKIIIYGILARREREKGDVVKVKRGQYGLAEWYPGLKGKRTREANGEEDE